MKMIFEKQSNGTYTKIEAIDRGHRVSVCGNNCRSSVVSSFTAAQAETDIISDNASLSVDNILALEFTQSSSAPGFGQVQKPSVRLSAVYLNEVDLTSFPSGMIRASSQNRKARGF